MGLRNYHPNFRKQHQLHHHDVDEHVYHELGSLHRLSLLLEERACSSEGEFLSPQPTQEEKPTMMEEEEDGSRSSSPIYAVPYENPYARIQQQPLSIESPFFQKQYNSSSSMASASSTSNYAIPFQSNAAPQWQCPPPPPLDKNANGEVDFLAELDKQIAELQIQSDAVRHLVEQAKERQELREKTRILCMEHINELRKMRWFMRNNFELCL
uniref:Uncharacterized protein n=1 Tax=Panagrolaimus sp. ES5 TaxID=591445 RepID=A0AC34GFI0_9BILA